MQCYRYLPINATLLDEYTFPAFMNCRTAIVYKTSEIGSCERHRFKSVQTGEIVRTFDQLTGKPVQSGKIKSHNIGHSVNWTGLGDIHPQIFKHLSLSNFSDNQINLFRTLRLFRSNVLKNDWDFHASSREFNSPAISAPTFFFAEFTHELVRKLFVTIVSLVITIHCGLKFALPRLFESGLRRAAERQTNKNVVKQMIRPRSYSRGPADKNVDERIMSPPNFSFRPVVDIDEEPRGTRRYHHKRPKPSVLRRSRRGSKRVKFGRTIGQNLSAPSVAVCDEN